MMNEFHIHDTLERSMMRKAMSQNEPINGSMELLPLCNMNCDMCYVRLSKAEMDARGHMHSGAEWLALGKEMAQNGVLFMLLTGGEPLLHPDFKDIYLGLKKLGMVLTINTNATLIDQEWADFFGRYKPRRINITLYGADNKAYEKLCHFPGGYDRVMHAIELLKENHVDIRLGCSNTPYNVQDMPRLFHMAKELDIPMTADTYMHPSIRERNKPFDMQSRLTPEAAAAASIHGRQLQDGMQAFAEYRQLALDSIDTFEVPAETPCSGTCMAGKCSFTINWQGQMRPCVLSTEPSISVFDSGFRKAWEYISCEFDKIRFCSKCSICKYRSICAVCPVAVKAETGSYDEKPEYLCQFSKELERLLRASPEEPHE